MPIMTWDSTLDIGVPEMNDDHQDILDAMNAIYDAHEAGEAGSRINLLIAELLQITAAHFRDEEAFMRKIDYFDLPNHKFMHERLLSRLKEHADSIRVAGGQVSDDFFQFLKFWLTSHIKGVDTKYAAHASIKKAG